MNRKMFASLLVGFLFGYLVASVQYLQLSRLNSWPASQNSFSVSTGRSVALEETSRFASSLSAFDVVSRTAYDLILDEEQEDEDSAARGFILEEWRNRTRGGLSDDARVMLADMYKDADSVFEFGLGESTYIANHVGVPRYAGIDSDSGWVNRVRSAVRTSFRFYFADIGETSQLWGIPLANRSKAILHYQIAPLLVERLPFQLYMVDGRWRRGCFFASFLHSSARGSSETTVLVHDCHRYEPDIAASGLFDLVRKEGNLCAFKRRTSTTDDDILESWNEHYIFSG